MKHETLQQKRAAHTGMWVFQEGALLRWKNGSGKPVLWCPGKRKSAIYLRLMVQAGSGKSTLAYFLGQ